MPWGNRPNRGSRWPALRRRILKRDQYRCYICGGAGADRVDHVLALCDGGTDAETNLAAVHDNPCHRRKTAQEGNRHRWANNTKPTTRRKPEAHPGLRSTGQ